LIAITDAVAQRRAAQTAARVRASRDATASSIEELRQRRRLLRASRELERLALELNS